MGICIGLLFDPELPEAVDAFDTDGKVVANSLTQLDELCSGAGVKALSNFVDKGEFEDDVDDEEDLEASSEGDFDDAAVESSSEPDYHECSELMATVTVLLDQLESKSSKGRFDREHAEAIAEDLRLLKRSLEIASRMGAKCMLFLW